MVIYITTNLINGKKYIGLDSRNDPNYLGSGDILKDAIKKYGRENFKKEIIEECKSLEELSLREEYWINHYNAVKSKKFYNLRPGGSQHFNTTPETRNKISISNKGVPKPKPKDWGEKMRKINKGRIFSDEWKKKISEGKKGKKRSQKLKDKMSKIMRAKGGRKVIQIDVFNNIIKEYKDCEEVVKTFPISMSILRNACTKNKLAKGYYWKYGYK